MKTGFRGALAVLALTTSLAACATAEQMRTTLGAEDARIAASLPAEAAKGDDGYGYAFFDAGSGSVKGECLAVTASVAGVKPDGSYSYAGSIRATERQVVTDELTLPKVLKLKQGDYVIGKITCLTTTKRAVLGKHATFRVNAGEFVELGRIDVNVKEDPGLFTRTGKISSSVGPLTPEVEAKLVEYYPTLSARRAKRSLRLLNEAEPAISFANAMRY